MTRHHIPLGADSDEIGGASLAEYQTTITTDPATFDHEPVVMDFAQWAFFQQKVEITAIDADGETFGNAEDDSELGIIWVPETSSDGENWTNANPIGGLSDTVVGDSGTPARVGDYQLSILGTLRYVRFTGFTIVSSVSDTPYGGANNPTVTLQITVQAR